MSPWLRKIAIVCAGLTVVMSVQLAQAQGTSSPTPPKTPITIDTDQGPVSLVPNPPQPGTQNLSLNHLDAMDGASIKSYEDANRQYSAKVLESVKGRLTVHLVSSGVPYFVQLYDAKIKSTGAAAVAIVTAKDQTPPGSPTPWASPPGVASSTRFALPQLATTAGADFAGPWNLPLSKCSPPSYFEILNNMDTHLRLNCGADIAIFVAIVGVISAAIAWRWTALNLRPTYLMALAFFTAVIVLGVALFTVNDHLDITLPTGCLSGYGCGGSPPTGSTGTGALIIAPYFLSTGNYCTWQWNGTTVNGCAPPEMDRWAGSNYDARLQVSLKDLNDNNVQTISQTCAGCGWGGWQTIPGSLTSTPSTGWASPTGQSEQVLYAMSGNNVMQAYQYTSSPNTWFGWNYVNCCFTTYGMPEAVMNGDGTSLAVAVGNDGNLYVINGSSFTYLGTGGGGAVTANPWVGTNIDGTLQIFVVTQDAHARTIRQTSSAGGWGGWQDLGCCVSGQPVVGRNADGRLEMFVRAGDNSFWHQWQTYPGSSSWSTWYNLGGAGTLAYDATVFPNADGRLELFGVDPNGNLVHRWQNGPNSDWYPNWVSFGCCLAGTVGVQSNPDGRLEFFAVGTDSVLYHQWQTSPAGGWIGNYYSLGGSFALPH